MGKTSRAGGGTVAGVGQTRLRPVLLRGARTVLRDGALEFAGSDGGIPDTVLTRAAGGGLSTPGALAVGGAQTVTGDQTVTGGQTVTGTLTALGYLAVGGNAGVTGALDVAGNLSGGWQPRDAGLVAWNLDPATASGTLLLTNGTIYLVKLPICRDVTPTKLYWYVTTQATTATVSQNWVAILSSAGVVLGSAVDVAAATESAGLKTTTVAPGALTAGSFVWGAIVANASTAPTLAVAPASALSALTNVGLAAAGLRHATNGTSQTTITNRTPASNSAGSAVWMGLGT